MGADKYVLLNLFKIISAYSANFLFFCQDLLCDNTPSQSATKWAIQAVLLAKKIYWFNFCLSFSGGQVKRKGRHLLGVRPLMQGRLSNHLRKFNIAGLVNLN